MIKIRLREILREKGLTSKDLAAKTGLTTTYISYICNSKAFPSLNVLNRLCAALEIDASELFKKPLPTDEFVCPTCGDRFKIVRIESKE